MLKRLDFNKQNKNQERKGLKILIPDQMLNITISIAHLKARNNSEKLKNEIRQFYFLYHSKKLTKTIYNDLINTI